MIWTHNLSPYIFKVHLFGMDLGPRWYGLAYIIGFILGYRALRAAYVAGKFPTLKESDVENLMLWLVGGVILGGRLGYCLQNLGTWAKDPLYFFRFSQGGMAFFGGLAGVVLVLIFYSGRKGLKFAVLGDVCTVPAALGLGIGRIANFINGELPGVKTDGKWGVIFPGTDGVPRHPSVLYEMATHFLLAAVLIWAGKRDWSTRRPGILGALFVVGYGLLRVVTEHFREAETYVGPLTNGQVASLVIAGAGGVVLWRLLSKKDVNIAKKSEIDEKSECEGN
ncbi:MAG: prolipoprotein diacylglyceryl transferase [Fimbriimonadaceae bacterium]